MARREILARRNIVPARQDCSHDFTEGIAEYLRTRPRAASMTSLFGSSENIEEEEIRSFRPRASTFSHLLDHTPGNSQIKDDLFEYIESEELLISKENILKNNLKIKIAETNNEMSANQNKVSLLSKCKRNLFQCFKTN